VSQGGNVIEVDERLADLAVESGAPLAVIPALVGLRFIPWTRHGDSPAARSS
jgi:hypothetical protein